MIREIQAKVLLAHVRQPEPWFGLKYIRRFGNQYFAPAQNLPQLEAAFRVQCQKAGLLTAIPQFTSARASQLRLPIG
jgi:hypothetical protein